MRYTHLGLKKKTKKKTIKKTYCTIEKTCTCPNRVKLSHGFHIQEPAYQHQLCHGGRHKLEGSSADFCTRTFFG